MGIVRIHRAGIERVGEIILIDASSHAEYSPAGSTIIAASERLPVPGFDERRLGHIGTDAAIDAAGQGAVTHAAPEDRYLLLLICNLNNTRSRYMLSISAHT